MGKIQSTGYVPHSWGESMKTYSRFVSHFYFIHFEIQNIDLFNLSNIYRNTGIFAEGPMFNICLCVSLMIELFLKDVIKKWRIVILTVTIITVFSTTGFIFLFLSFFCFLFLNNRKKGITKRVWKNGLFLIVAFCAYFFIELIANEKKESYSYQERNEHIELGIKMWEASPFFGNGYFATADRVVSNGIWRILADGGIYFFLLYTTAFLFIPYWYYIKYKRRGFLFVFLLMFFLLYPTIVSYRGVTLMFIALAFSVFLQKAHNRNYIVYRN
jgi:hypothetical protein